MTTARTDLIETYRELAKTAPTRHVLRLPHTERARRPLGGLLAIGGAVVAVLLLAVAPVLVVRQLRADGGTAEPAQPNATADFPTGYVMGAQALAGYALWTQDLRPEGQEFTFRAVSKAIPKSLRLVTVIEAPVTTANDKIYRQGTPVKLASATGYYNPKGYADAPMLSWVANPRQWYAIALAPSSKTTGATQTQLTSLTKQLQTRKRDTSTALSSLAKIGYLPPGSKFSYAAMYVDQPGGMAAPDGVTGSGYRIIDFTGGVGATAGADLSIYTVYDPKLSLTRENLPVLNSPQWSATTVQGHPAFITAHDVIVQWGKVQIHVESGKVEGSSTPQYGQAELLKVAKSLTVGADLSEGHGYPILTAVPEGHLH